MTPLVSVAIFAHDHERYVASCIDSFLAQSIADRMEIVIVDDASTDGTWSVIEQYRDHPRVARAIRHPENLKAPQTYRDGMAAATGRYLVPVDGDDCALSDCALERCVEVLERDPRIGFVHTAFELIDSDGSGLGTQRVDRRSNVMASRDAFRRLLMNNFIHHSGTMMRREQFEEAGGYNVGMMYSVDWELWLRISARHALAYIADPLYAYRIHPGNLHLTRARVLDAQVRELIDVVDRAVAYGPADLASMRRSAHAAVYLLLASWRFAHFEGRQGRAALAQAFTEDRLIFRQREFWRAVARFAAAAVLREGGYGFLRSVRDRLRLARGRQRERLARASASR